jgi:hypothetical protein
MYSEATDRIKETLHTSHKIENVWLDFDSSHDPTWTCSVCLYSCCQWGDAGDTAELREPCLGKRWYED